MAHPEDVTVNVTISEDTLAFTLTEETIDASVLEEVINVDDVEEVFNITNVEETFQAGGSAEDITVTLIEETFDFAPAEVIIYRQEDFVLYDEELDQVGDDVIYRGQAAAGSATSDAAWRIRKLTRTVDDQGKDNWSTRWADGTVDFDKVWDSRIGYTY
jgi:hypothetical protein